MTELFAAVGGGAREATAQRFEERGRENHGEYGERDVRCVHEREAGGGEQREGANRPRMRGA